MFFAIRDLTHRAGRSGSPKRGRPERGRQRTSVEQAVPGETPPTGPAALRAGHISGTAQGVRAPKKSAHCESATRPFPAHVKRPGSPGPKSRAESRSDTWAVLANLSLSGKLAARTWSTDEKDEKAERSGPGCGCESEPSEGHASTGSKVAAF